MVVEKINSSEEFDTKVLKSDLPVIVDFWAAWCAPCRLLSPIVEEIEKDYTGKVNFFSLNVDDIQSVAEKYNIMSIPTLLMFDKAEVKSMSVGAVPKESLKGWIDSNL